MDRGGKLTRGDKVFLAWSLDTAAWICIRAVEVYSEMFGMKAYRRLGTPLPRLHTFATALVVAPRVYVLTTWRKAKSASAVSCWR